MALADIAVASQEKTPPWIYRYYEFAKGLAEYRAGRFDNAVDVMTHDASTVMGPAPRLVAAMASHRLGNEADARKMLAAAEMERDWSASAATERDIWIQHIQRREAEQLIAPELATFFRGKYAPRDELEREIFIGECQFRGMHEAAAGLYSKIFAGQPELVGDLTHDARLFAARSAALAGCGRSADSGTLDAESGTRWRRQARQWLSADVQARLAAAHNGPRRLERRCGRRWTGRGDRRIFRRFGMRAKLRICRVTNARSAWRCGRRWTRQFGRLMR